MMVSHARGEGIARKAMEAVRQCDAFDQSVLRSIFLRPSHVRLETPKRAQRRSTIDDRLLMPSTLAAKSTTGVTIVVQNVRICGSISKDLHTPDWDTSLGMVGSSFYLFIYFLTHKNVIRQTSIITMEASNPCSVFVRQDQTILFAVTNIVRLRLFQKKRLRRRRCGASSSHCGFGPRQKREYH